jgi:hypothetical protein
MLNSLHEIYKMKLRRIQICCSDGMHASLSSRIMCIKWTFSGTKTHQHDFMYDDLHGSHVTG